MRNSSVEFLTPRTRRLANELMDFLHAKSARTWVIFETYRSPSDQYSAMLKGNSKVGPMHSAHQYGLAFDVVPTKDNKPYWPEVGDPAWQELHEAVSRIDGLTVPILWDPGHVQDSVWDDVRKTLTT